MQITGLDHIVLCVRDINATVAFYRRVLGLDARQSDEGGWSLHFGTQKISLQNAASPPLLAADTYPGTGNFCLLTDTPILEIVEELKAQSIELAGGPVRKTGAQGPLMSVYFRDPDNNLIEVSNLM